MVKEYKHLDEKSKKKILIFIKTKNFFKKSIKWWLITSGIFLIFIVGLIAFYITLEKNNYFNKNIPFSQVINSFSKTNENNENLNQIEQKEFIRESKKEKILSDSNILDDYKFNLDFYDFSDWNKTCEEELIVVNNKNKLDSEYKPETKNCRGKEVNVILVKDLEQMILDAKKDGIILWVSSGYRSVNYQKKLFDAQVEREKSKEIISNEEAENRAAKVVARPLTSEHNTGLAIDFNGVEDGFYKTKEYKWLMENAEKYGFIERYQEQWKQKTGVIYEPWHFRYVGKKHAPLLKESGICLEEYVQKLIKQNYQED